MDHAQFALHYVENSDTEAHSSVRFFIDKENARTAMKAAFLTSNNIIHFPPSDPNDPEYNEADDHYTKISADEIIVHDGIDSYTWSILDMVPEDGENDARMESFRQVLNIFAEKEKI